MAVIETRNLRKRYKRVEALRGVTLKVEPGEIFGLLGQNGAGKTTLIKILLGIVKNAEGEALLFHEPAGTADVRKRVGYLPEDHRFPEYHSAYSLMDYYGTLYGMSKDDRRKKIPELLDQVGLASRMHHKIRTYSKGMKQRTGIAQAIFHDPELIFLDEPTDGVDPVGRREIREMIEDRKRKGATVFVNSHLLGEVELMCDRVAIMQKGELIREGTVQELTARRGVFVLGVDGGPFPEAEVKGLGFSLRPSGGKWEVTLADGQTIDPVLHLVREKGLRMTHMVEQRQTLEDIFVSLVESAEPGVDARRRKRQADRDEYDRGRGRGREDRDDGYDDDRRGRREDYR
ncbi:MAG TPA: ABC transporter ATP-binding protein [Gemmataceae bacterium]|nr:ABC transporter ATP-binding protein [Gemmataceae bacterium]